VGAHSKKLRIIAVFGSSVYDPVKARDLDILIIIDKLLDIKEKTDLEIRILKNLKNLRTETPLDIIVLDEESFKENLEPGGIASGLVAGCRILYDEMGTEQFIYEAAKKVANEKYVIFKKRRKIDLSTIAKLKLKTNHRT
jgi:hypothetical protein